MKKLSVLEKLKRQGFDESRAIPFEHAWRIGCSQCEALCINGIATHERGCPKQTYKCRGCNTILSRKEYCSDCKLSAT